MRGIVKSTYFDYITTKQMVVIETSLVYEEKLRKLIGKEIDFDKHRELRSLQANAYCWKLCTQIAEVLGTTKEEVYLKELKRYGQSLLIPVAKDSKPNGYFKYYEFEGRRLLNNREVDFYKVFKGSSDYDSKEMSVLLDGIVQDAKELNIETLEDIKIKEMIDMWS